MYIYIYTHTNKLQVEPGNDEWRVYNPNEEFARQVRLTSEHGIRNPNDRDVARR